MSTRPPEAFRIRLACLVRSSLALLSVKRAVFSVAAVCTDKRVDSGAAVTIAIIGEAHHRVKQSRDPSSDTFVLSPSEGWRGQPTSVRSPHRV